MIGIEVVSGQNIADEIKADVVEKAKALLDGTGKRVFERVVQMCPIRTGRLKASLVLVYSGGQVKIYSQGVYYAGMIAKGTQWHQKAADAAMLEPAPEAE